MPSNFNSNVNVNITAQSKQARDEVNNLAKSIKSLGSTSKSSATGAKGLSNSVGSLVKGFTIGTLAAQGIQKALALVKQEFINSIKEANNYANALIGLSSVSAAFGQSQSEARQAAIDLSRDGLMSVTEAAEGLKNLLATGFSLDEAINLMRSFKDAAAFNRQGTLEFGQAIVGATQGIKNQNSIMVDNVGITKNLSNILKEAGLSTNQLADVTSDAAVRQKLYNGLLKEASVFTGDAARAAETMSGKMSTMNTMFKMARVEVGNALSPALMDLMDDFTRVASVVGKILLPALKGLITIFTGAITAARLLGNTISGVIATFIAVPQAIKERSLDPLKATFRVVGEDYGNILEGAAETISKTWSNEMGDIARDTIEGLGDASSAASEKAAKLAKSLKKENEDFMRDMASMTKSFQENLSDLIFSHRDKKAQLEEDIKEENEAYKNEMADRKDQYNEDLEDLEKSHKDKVSNIKDDIADEEEALIVSQNKLQAFQDDKYLQDINRSKKKLEELKSDLAKEEDEYKRKKEKVVSVYEEETKKIETEHNKRLTALKSELEAELAIYIKHESDFTALKDAVAEDDITRLKRKFEEEKAERERQHAEKISELYQQGAKETAAYEAGKSNASSNDTSQRISQASQQANQTSSQVSNSLGLTNVGVGSNSPNTSTGSSFFSTVKEVASNIGNAISNTFNSVVGWFSSKLPQFEEGGIVNAPVGQPVMAVVHGGEKVIPASQVNSPTNNVSNNINVNIGIYAGSEVEKRNLAMKLWSEIGRLAKSQNKTPSELIGFNGA